MKMAFNPRTLALFITISALIAASVRGQDMPSCTSGLIPCASYLNVTATSPAPPASCCGPLKDAAVKQTACLCGLLNNKELLKSFNVDPAQGLLLAKKCNVSADASTCSKATAPTSSSSPSTSTPSTSKGTSENSTNGAPKASWTAINGIVCLLSPLLWTIIA